MPSRPFPLEVPCRLCGSLHGVRRPTGWACAYCEWTVGTYIDPDLPPPRIDVVYYLRLGARVKIGTTHQPRQRFAALPHDEVLAFELGDRALEQQRHVEFAADRLGTSEWFALTRNLRAHIRRLCADRDPWRTHARWMSAALAERAV